MKEHITKTYESPWHMPEEIFADTNSGAELRRVQWVLDNQPDVSLEEIILVMSPRDATLASIIQARQEHEYIADINDVVVPGLQDILVASDPEMEPFIRQLGAKATITCTDGLLGAIKDNHMEALGLNKPPSKTSD
jgi:hypothetical protein